MSECEAHSEADNDTIEDVDLTTDDECTGSINGEIFDHFQPFFPFITSLLAMRWCNV